MMTVWTPQLDAVIRAGRAAKLSYGQIARKMRMTKGAVLGRDYRLKGYVRPRTRRSK